MTPHEAPTPIAGLDRPVKQVFDWAVPAGRTKRDGPETADTAHGRRHEGILDSALDLFADRGFHGASVREIAQRVGVNEATLYHYFPSKAAILDAIIDQVLAERREMLKGFVDPRASLPTTLRRLASGVLDRSLAPRERRIVCLMMIEGPRLAVEGRYPFLRLIGESTRRVREMFDRLIADGKMRRIDTRLASLEFMAPIMIFAQHQHVLGGVLEDPLDPATFVRSHVDLFARAFAPGDGRPRSGTPPRGRRKAGR